MLKIAIVANEPPPYRVPVFNRIARAPDVDFRVFFCCEREPNRLWNLPPFEFEHGFLRERITTVNGRYIHNNPDVIASLSRFSPDVIITNGFNPTHLYAFGLALVKRVTFVPMTDGTYLSEQTLSAAHRAVRRFVYSKSDAFIAASHGGQKLYESYGIAAERCFRSHLCIDNQAFSPATEQEQKRFDFIFCGRIEPGKNPEFALRVAMEAARRLNRKVDILFVGSGSREESVRRAASVSDLVNVEFNGFAEQQELPALYRSARIFLFPTLADVWGVVANEACAAGLPLIVSSYAGAAGELVLNDENGFVCDLDVDLWAERAVQLLTQPQTWQEFSERSLALVSQYTFERAASGILDACRFARSV